MTIELLIFYGVCLLVGMALGVIVGEAFWGEK